MITIIEKPKVEQVITIQDAMYLMKALENDIPICDRSKIALLLLVLSANPSLTDDGSIITNKRRQTTYDYENWFGYDGY